MTRFKLALGCAALALVAIGWVGLGRAEVWTGPEPAVGAARGDGQGPAAARVDTNVHMTTVAHVGGYANAVAGVGGHALVGEGSHVLSVSLLDPTAPRVVWRSADFGGDVRQILVAGRLALIPGPDLRVLDVSDPALPRQVGVYPDAAASAVAAEGATAYLLSGRTIEIVDLADPSTPGVLGSFEIATPGTALAASGGILWIADDNGDVHAVDARDLAAPRELSSVPGQDTQIGYARCVAAGSNRVVVSGRERRHVNVRGMFVVFDASDPSAPRLLARVFTASDNPGRCALVDGRFYLTLDDAGAEVYDVTGPGAPNSIAGLYTPADATDIQPLGDLTLVTDSAAYARVQLGSVARPGLHVFRGSGRIGGIESLTDLTSVVLSDGRAYVAGAASGLHVLDVAEPGHPVALGTADIAGGASNLVVDGTTLLVDEARNRVALFDITVPAAPRRVGALTVGEPAVALAARDGVALVPDGSGLAIVDYKTPNAARQVGGIRLDGPPADVALAGGLALVASGGLQLLDIAQPARPTLLGRLPGYGTQAVAPSGRFAYLGQRVPGYEFIPTAVPPTPGPSPTGTPATPTPAATPPPDGGRITVVDIAQPNGPRVVGASAGLYDQPINVVRAGHERVWSLSGPDSGWRRVIAVDVSDPAQPAELNLLYRHPLPSPLQPNDIAVDGDYVYLAARAGLLVLRAERPAAVVPRVWLPWAQR